MDNSVLRLLPEQPIGDVEFDGDDESGDVDEMLDIEEGDVEFLDYDETGAPKKRKMSKRALVNRVATGTANAAMRRALKKLKRNYPGIGSKFSAHALIRAASRNESIQFEHARGAKLISSSLGPRARLRASEVQALQSGIYLSTPFEPTVFGFTAADPAVGDPVSALDSVIGAGTIRYAGFYLVLAASTLNINQGATITITRNLGLIDSNQQSVVTTWQLESGVRSVNILLLNGILIAGKPRLFMPEIAGNAAPDATTEISISGLPANYTPTFRFIQPGDGTIDKFLLML